MDERTGKATDGSCTLGIIMVSMDRKHGYGHIQIWIFVINCWEPVESFRAVLAVRLEAAYENPDACPSDGSLSSSICTGLSPRVYSLSNAVT